MKQIQLMTYQNSLYADYLGQSGYEVIPYDLPLSQNDYQRLASIGKNSLVILEIHQDDLKLEMIRFLALKNRVLAIVPELTSSLKDLLLGAGICDLFTSHNPKRIIPYIRLMESEDPVKSGSFLVLDDQRARFNMISRIISRFGYEVKRAEKVDDIFNSLDDQSLNFILVNLGTRGFDVNELVRRGFSNLDLKKIPLIAYKDMDEGLFVHEMISGLNRLTRFIISPKELYSFLVDLLFRKEILPLVEVMKGTVNYEDNDHFCHETLSQIYFSRSCSIFELENLLTEENVETMLHLVSLYRNAVVKVDGFRWLKIEHQKSVTCGVGAGSYCYP